MVTKTDLDLDKIQLEWCRDILTRINVALDDPQNSDQEKIQIAKWLVKQALKIDRED
jgi:hypothetical protein